MDFRLSDEQVALQDAIRAYCRDRYSFERICTLDEQPLLGVDWRGLHDLDVFRVAASTDAGGLGLGAVESVVVFEVLGEHLVPGPLVWTALATQHLGGTANGAVVGGLDLRDSRPAEPTVLEYGTDLTALVVLRDDGAHLLDAVEQVHRVVEPVRPTDPLTPVCVVSHIPPGRRVADAHTADRMRTTGIALTSALLVGIAERALQAAVDHARDRQQFGRPIGSFQAVQHLLADMYVRVSLARGAAYGAAAIIDGLGSGDAITAAATAKLLAAEAAIRNARSCIQALGGMGFTWDMIPHYLLKRAWVLEHSFGTRAQHAESVARELEREVA